MEKQGLESDHVDCAKKHGLKEIPFEPSGTETGKYPIVRSDDFDLIMKHAQDLRTDKKTDFIIVRSPMGGGKTATSRGVIQDFKNDPKVTVCKTVLLNFMPSDLVGQIKRYALNSNLVSEKFLKSIGFSDTVKYDESQLTNFVIKIFEESLKDKELGIWIIDEFDTISSKSSSGESQISDKEKMSFLGWLRNVYDTILNSDVIKSKKGFLFVMAHTEDSSKEFKKYLQSLNTPLMSRNYVLIDIGYRFDEVCKIVQSRLFSRRLDKQNPESIEPFTDNALKLAYSRINDYTKSNELINFRLYERVLYITMKMACEQNLKVIDVDLIEKALREAVKNETGLTEIAKKVSLETRSNIDKITTSPKNTQNMAILEGIKKGMQSFMENDFTDISNPKSGWIKNTVSGMIFNDLKLTTQLSTGESISTVWYCIDKEKESFESKDFEELELELQSLKSERLGTNLTLLFLVTDVEYTKSQLQEIKNVITSVDKIALVNNDLKKELIGLYCSKIEEKDEYKDEFNRILREILSDMFKGYVRDITTKISPSILGMVQILNVLKKAKNIIITNNILREDAKLFFAGTSKPSVTIVNQMISMGFAVDDSQNGLIPSIPKTLEDLRTMLYNKIGIEEIKKQIHNYTEVIKAARYLGLVNENNEICDVEVLRTELDNKIEEAKKLLQDKTKKDNKAFHDLDLLCSAYDGANISTSNWDKIIIFNFVKNTLFEKISGFNKLPKTGGTSGTTFQSPQQTERQATRQESYTEEKDKHTSKPIAVQLTFAAENYYEAVQKILEVQPLIYAELVQKMKDEGLPSDQINKELTKLIFSGKVRLTL